MSDRAPDTINNFAFNTNMWNDDAAAMQAPRTTYYPLAEQAFDPLPPTSTRPLVLSDFIGEATQVTTNAPAPVQTETLSGEASMVRAVSTLHQYAIGFWDPDAGILDALAADQQADPSEPAIDEMYIGHRVRSYTPAELELTREEYGELVKPSGSTTVLSKSLGDMGIGQTMPSVGTAAPLSLSEISARSLGRSTPFGLAVDQRPFASSLSKYCTSASTGGFATEILDAAAKSAKANTFNISTVPGAL